MLCTNAMRESILARLTGDRHKHTLGVEKAAIQLAERFGADAEACAFAGILHDITKRLSQQEQLNLCEKYGIIACDIEKQEWKMLHGKTAAAIAQHEYHAPQAVVDAIACHTTGKKNMTMLDKILYMADYIEENRDFDGVDRARVLAKKDIDLALLYCFDQSLTDLLARNKLIHPDTMEARNDLLQKGVHLGA